MRAAPASEGGHGCCRGGRPLLPRAARLHGAPLGRVGAPGGASRAAPVLAARGSRCHRQGGREEGEGGREQAGAREAHVEADPVRLQEDPQHHDSQRPHRHLWYTYLS